MAKPLYDFSHDISFEDAARSALLSGYKKMMDNAKGTSDGLKKNVASPAEIEALHDMRVGSRRLRSALSVFGTVFSPADFKAADKEVGAITDALGGVRDLDVQLDSLRVIHSGLPANEAYGIGRMIERQAKKRDEQRTLLLNALDKLKKDRFERRFLRLVDHALPKAAEPGPPPTTDSETEAA
jgi:CHAD domain-containing protein